jgi:hypothetical protein
MWDPDVDPYHADDTWYVDWVKCAGLIAYGAILLGLIWLGFRLLF